MSGRPCLVGIISTRFMLKEMFRRAFGWRPWRAA